MHVYFNGAMTIYSNSGSLIFHLVFSPCCCTPFFCLLMCNTPFAFALPWCFPQSDLLWSTSIFNPEYTLLGAEERSGKQEPWWRTNTFSVRCLFLCFQISWALLELAVTGNCRSYSKAALIHLILSWGHRGTLNDLSGSLPALRSAPLHCFVNPIIFMGAKDNLYPNKKRHWMVIDQTPEHSSPLRSQQALPHTVDSPPLDACIHLPAEQAGMLLIRFKAACAPNSTCPKGTLSWEHQRIHTKNIAQRLPACSLPGRLDREITKAVTQPILTSAFVCFPWALY